MISLPRRGAISVLNIEVERELNEEDLVQLANLPANSPPPVKSISARYRRTAMMLAEGKSNNLIAEALGYTPQRVSQLKQEAAFQHLVAYYEDQIHENSLRDEQRFQEKLRSAGEQALDEINERLEDQEQVRKIPTTVLKNIVEMAADRTVAPPKVMQNTPQAPATITLNFGTELKRRDEKEIAKVKTITSNGEEEEEE